MKILLPRALATPLGVLGFCKRFPPLRLGKAHPLTTRSLRADRVVRAPVGKRKKSSYPIKQLVRALN